MEGKKSRTTHFFGFIGSSGPSQSTHNTLASDVSWLTVSAFSVVRSPCGAVVVWVECGKLVFDPALDIGVVLCRERITPDTEAYIHHAVDHPCDDENSISGKERHRDIGKPWCNDALMSETSVFHTLVRIGRNITWTSDSCTSALDICTKFISAQLDVYSSFLSP